MASVVASFSHLGTQRRTESWRGRQGPKSGDGAGHGGLLVLGPKLRHGPVAAAGVLLDQPRAVER